MKKYIVIAGVNGAGKSTLYQTNDSLKNMPRVNVETFQQLNFILKECNLVAFYDNTDSFRRFAICKNGELVRISHNVPKWFARVQISEQS